MGKSAKALLLYGSVLLLAALVFYLDRTGAVSTMIRRLGPAGILLAVFLMLVISLTPVPAEGLLLVYLRVYGVWWGTVYAWLGALASAVVIFPMARRYGRPLLRRFIRPETFDEIDNWVRRRGQLGLLFARLLPVPGFVVGYVAGTLPSVGLWAYLWTAGVSLIPYYGGVALVFLGITSELTVSLFLGAVALAAFAALGLWMRRQTPAAK